MDNKKSTSQIMRQVAGWLYFALCVFQMLSLYTAWTTGFTGVYNSWLIELGLMVLYGVGAVYMISGKETLRQPLRRGVVIATALVVIFSLVTHQTQLTMYELLLTTWFPAATVAVIWHVVFLIIRLVLLILAAFFVASSSEETDKKEEEDVMAAEGIMNEETGLDFEDEDDVDTVIIEETVITEEAPEEKTEE